MEPSDRALSEDLQINSSTVKGERLGGEAEWDKDTPKENGLDEGALNKGS